MDAGFCIEALEEAIERYGAASNMNVFIHLKDMTDGFVAQKEIGDWISFYNRIRPHSSLDGKTPYEVYSKAQDMGNAHIL